MNTEIFIVCILYLILRIYKNDDYINIYIGNSFRNYYSLPSNSITCNYNKRTYKCRYLHNKNKKYHASIYNGNRYFPNKPNFSYNIIITTEKLSQVIFMKNIGDGCNKNYHLAVDYRLFNNRWHISFPYYSRLDINQFIYIAKRNYGYLSLFMKRKNRVVYIQKARYKNREYIVKEIMKYIPIDSYGADLNNKEWPKNISKKNKIEIYKQYKFCLAIENSVITWKEGEKYEASSINNDYVTEKLIDCFKAGCIPLYFGPKNVNLFIPHPDSIINFSSFNSIENLGHYINNIMNNTTKLEKHLKWYCNISKEWMYRFKINFTFSYCKICTYVKLYSKNYNIKI